MKGIIRIVSLALVFCFLLLPLGALASSAQDMSISVQWTDAWGAVQWSNPAEPVTGAPEETRFWLTLPPEAPLTGLTLNISDLSGTIVSFEPGQGAVLENVTDAGGSLDQPSAVIYGYNADGGIQAFYSLYISYQQLPQTPMNVSAAVTVHYIDEYSQPLREDQVLTLDQGSHTITALDIPGYTLISPASFGVTVDGGSAFPSDITFAYNRAEITGQVTVHYVDENGATLLPDQIISLPEGVTDVSAIPLDGYDMQGQTQYSVTVDYNGTYPSDITFYYSRRIITGTVTVHYRDENNFTLQPDQTMTFGEGVSAVYAVPIDGYTLTSASSCPIVVDETGADPGEVTFTYTRIVSSASVTVRHVDENGNSLIPDVVYTYDVGQHQVTATAIDQYVPTGSTQYTVTVDEDGATPEIVTFTFTRYIAPADVLVHFVDENGSPLLQDALYTLEGGSHVLLAEAIPHYTVQGTGMETVNITLEGAIPAEITFRYAREVLPADIVIHYVDDAGTTLADDTVQTLQPGVTRVYPAAAFSETLYMPASPESYDVSVTADGVFPAEITFTYRRVVQPVDVTVHYVDDRGSPVAPDEVLTFGEGEHVITPAANVSAEDYQSVQPTSYPLTVTLEGGSLTEVTFTYNRVVKPALVTVHYTDAQGTPVADDTQQWIEGGSFVIFPQPANLRQRYVHTADDPEFQTVTVDADGAHPSEITFIYEYTPHDPVTLPVLYRDAETGADVALSGTVTLAADAVTPVTAHPESLLPDYVLLGDSTVNVSVNADGEADRSEIVFLYQYVEPTPEPTLEPTATPEPTPEPTDTPEPTPEPAPVMVTVRYVDADGQDVASPGVVWCSLGDTEITAAPTDLTEGYLPDGPQTVLVHVDENGPDPAEILFTYRLTAEPVAPKVALVNVKYLSPKEEVFYSYSATCVEGQENKVEVDLSLVDSSLGYELASEPAVYVTVDETGAAFPAEVVFRFGNEVNAYVNIYYRDAATGRDVASPQQQLCYVGTNTVDIRPLDLEENYALFPGTTPATVTLDADGRLIPDQVIFLYMSVAEATATPEPQTLPYDTPMDAYFYPTGASVRLRSSPTTGTSDNFVCWVNTSNLGHAFGKVTASDGKVWYAVEINGYMGYMSESVVRFLSEAELAALFNYTLAPTQEPTPQPTEIPDGMVIDRWGTTLDSVNFRKKADKSADKYGTVKKDTRVWVYNSLTVNGEKWYAVRCSGNDGFMMAKYVLLASEADSAAIQAQLATPMPTQTPTVTISPVTQAPTDEPTDAPTEAPTEAPTDGPVQTPTVQPTETASYRGYAVTVAQTALRTGVDQKDDSILEMLPSNALVIVKDETYVDGAVWDCVEAQTSGSIGFVPQSSLRFISGEEVREYLERLQPSPTPTAFIAEQTEGYAMTMGSGVPMRNFPDTNGEIIDLLPYMAVAQVRGQQYVGSTAWHLVQYNGMWGYIRQDQLRMMSQEETQSYLDTLAAGTPTPSAAPVPTPMPVTDSNLSSYGHVQSNSGRVNLRSEPTTKKSNAIRLLDNYAFALVMGSVTNDEGTWYHISQAGTEGYILSTYFHVLTLGELSTFLKSPEYLNANSNNTTTDANSSQIQPVEDYNRNVWQNPALTASYEPFTPATPVPELAETPTPTPTPAPTATPEIAPVSPDNTTVIPENNVKQSGSPLPWVLLGLGVVGIGGAYYAYVRRQNEKRRQAMLAEQARAARSAAIRPQMRTAQNNPGQNQGNPAYPNSGAPFMPPQNGMPQSQQAASQNMGFYRPAGMTPNPADKGSAPQQQATQTYQPLRQDPRYGQNTQVFTRPGSQQGMEDLSGDPFQDSQSFRPAPVDPNARRLNLKIKTAKVSLDDLNDLPDPISTPAAVHRPAVTPTAVKPAAVPAEVKPAAAPAPAAVDPAAVPAAVDPAAASAAADPAAVPTATDSAAASAAADPAAAPRRRMRRTERNKDLYIDND